MPHAQATGEHADVIRRSIELLEGVLSKPGSASLQAMDEFVWLPWSRRGAVRGAGPLARLVWAAMGAVVVALPGNPSSSELPGLFRAAEDPKTSAGKIVWDQCATAIQMLAYDDPGIPVAVSTAFTMSVCHTTPPSRFTIIRRLEWAWQGLSFEVAVLGDNAGALHLEFIDRQGKEPLYSGPFARMCEVDDRLSLLKHQPVSIRFERIL